MLRLARLAHRVADHEVWREVRLGSTEVEAETVSCEPNEVTVRVVNSSGLVATVIAWRVEG